MNLRIALAVLCCAATAHAGGPAAAPETLEVRLLETPDGRPLKRELRRDAMPAMTIGVEASGLDPSHAALVVNGLLMDWAENTNGLAPFTARLRWWPWQGNGAYTIAAVARTWTDPLRFTTSRVLHAQIDGLNARTPSPLARMETLYGERFGLKLTRPSLARHVSPDPDQCRWISTAYVDRKLYEIHLYDDLRDVVRVRPVNAPASGGEQPVTRPAGRYKMLVVFVDHGNTGVSEPEAMLALQAAREEMNDRFARGAARFGLKDAVLKVDVFGAFATATGTNAIALLTPARIREDTGFDPAHFELIAQVELDAGGAVAAKAIRGYDGRPGSGVNIWMRVPRAASLENLLDRVLLDYQLNRTFGWMPEWPRGDGGFDNNNPVTDAPPPTLPSLLFGWPDLDGDQVPEILDLTPYGLQR